MQVACAFYLNALYAFPYYAMVADFARSGWLLRDVRGQLIGMENDNGMRHVPVWDWSQPAAVRAYLDVHRALAADAGVRCVVTMLATASHPKRPPCSSQFSTLVAQLRTHGGAEPSANHALWGTQFSSKL